MKTCRPGFRLLMITLMGLLVLGGASQAADDIEGLAQEYMRQHRPLTLKSNGTPALDLYALLFHKAEQVTIETLSNQSILAPHDAYRLVFFPSGHYYVYIFQVSMTREIKQIFPELTFEGVRQQYTNPVTQAEYTIPVAQHVIDIGYPPLLKDLYILISVVEEPYLTELYGKMNAAMMIDDQVTLTENRATLLSFLLSPEETVSVYHIQPHIDILQKDPASPVMVKEIVEWFKPHPEQTVWVPKSISPPEKHVPRITLFDLFQKGSDQLTPEATVILSAYGEALQDHVPDANMFIAVYTDWSRSASENTELAERQARRLIEFFTTEYRIKPERIKAQGYGNAYLLGLTKSEHSQHINNRIELIRY